MDISLEEKFKKKESMTNIITVLLFIGMSFYRRYYVEYYFLGIIITCLSAVNFAYVFYLLIKFQKYKIEFLEVKKRRFFLIARLIANFCFVFMTLYILYSSYNN